MIALKLLGSPELRGSGTPGAALLTQPRRLALLAYLAAAPGSFHRRDRLLLLFWGDQPEQRARASLRQALYVLRQSLGEDALVARGDEEIAIDRSLVSVDVVEFEAAARRDWTAALALYRGDFLADFNIPNAAEFERWASGRRRELRALALEGAWVLATDAVSGRDRTAALAHIERAVTLSDFAEADVARAIALLGDLGEPARASSYFDEMSERLAADRSEAPSAATRALLARVTSTRAQTPAAQQYASTSLDETNRGAFAAEPHVVTAAPARRSSARRDVRWLAIGALALIAGIGATLFYRSRFVTRGDNDTNRVAVLPFTVRAPGADVAYLRNGAATLLSLALDGAGRLRVVDPNAVASATPSQLSLHDAQSIAASLGAGEFVVGEVDGSTSHVSVTASLYDVTGHIRARATAAGDDQHVFVMVDSLARTLAIAAMTDSTVRLASDAASSTQSLTAFKAFLVGESSLREGHYNSAALAFEGAVRADSTFALAYYRLGLAREWTSGEISSDSAFSLAARYGARLPHRDATLLAARRAFVHRDRVSAEQVTREVLAAYPTDADAWAQLGEIRFHLGPDAGQAVEDARGPFMQVLHLRPADLSARVHLTRLAALRADSSDVARLTAGAWAENATEIGAFELAAMRAVVLGDSAAGDTIAAAARLADARILQSAAWRIAAYAGDPDAAARIVLLPHNASAHVADLTEWYVAGGRFPEMLRRADDARAPSAVASALLLAMPSSPSLPQLARETSLILARVPSDSAISLDAPRIAARLLAARYPQSALAELPRISNADTATVNEIVAAIRMLPSDPQRAFALVDSGRLSDAVLYRGRLFDAVASIRAEALHRMHRDAAAIAWLHTVGINSASLVAARPLALRRAAELAAAVRVERMHAVGTQDRARFQRMWRSCSPELRPFRESPTRHASALLTH